MRIPALTALCILAGCASVPPSSEMTASDAGAAPVNRVAQEPASASSKHKFKPPPGYKVKIDDWDIVYCRKMPILGSRFPKEICMTEAQLKEHMASNETFKRDKDQVSVVCAAYAGCANP